MKNTLSVMMVLALTMLNASSIHGMFYEGPHSIQICLGELLNYTNTPFIIKMGDKTISKVPACITHPNFAEPGKGKYRFVQHMFNNNSPTYHASNTLELSLKEDLTYYPTIKYVPEKPITIYKEMHNQLIPVARLNIAYMQTIPCIKPMMCPSPHSKMTVELLFIDPQTHIVSKTKTFIDNQFSGDYALKNIKYFINIEFADLIENTMSYPLSETEISFDCCTS